MSVRIGRGLIRDLTGLRREAQEVSGTRLPRVMRRLAAGEQVDIETEVPRLQYADDEIGQVGQALNTLQRAAVEAAVRQADMRKGVSDVFVNLARRSQVLLHRQLTLLDAMERRTEDADELADLFRLDHMTTRMRRHAEGLVILSGAAPSRQWRKPVQLMDVVRAAVAEVEDYERIEVRRLPRLAVAGAAVADLTHLLAELMENAAVFSPPHTAVRLHGERVANGFVLEIDDRGLGMTPDALLEANLRLAETPEFELSDTDRLGLFVVSRLAQRHGVRVSLRQSPYGGTTAVVLIPAEPAHRDRRRHRLHPVGRPEPAAGRRGDDAEHTFRQWGLDGRRRRAAQGARRARRRARQLLPDRASPSRTAPCRCRAADAPRRCWSRDRGRPGRRAAAAATGAAGDEPRRRAPEPRSRPSQPASTPSRAATARAAPAAGSRPRVRRGGRAAAPPARGAGSRARARPGARRPRPPAPGCRAGSGRPTWHRSCGAEAAAGGRPRRRRRAGRERSATRYATGWPSLQRGWQRGRARGPGPSRGPRPPTRRRPVDTSTANDT